MLPTTSNGTGFPMPGCVCGPHAALLPAEPAHPCPAHSGRHASAAHHRQPAHRPLRQAPRGRPRRPIKSPQRQHRAQRAHRPVHPHHHRQHPQVRRQSQTAEPQPRRPGRTSPHVRRSRRHARSEDLDRRRTGSVPRRHPRHPRARALVHPLATTPAFAVEKRSDWRGPTSTSTPHASPSSAPSSTSTTPRTTDPSGPTPRPPPADARSPWTQGLLPSSAHTKHSAPKTGSSSAPPGNADVDDLVFTRADGRPYHPERLSRSFKSQVRSSCLPEIRLHDLRHTWATLALQAGIPAKIVQDRLGHFDGCDHVEHLQPRDTTGAERRRVRGSRRDQPRSSLTGVVAELAGDASACAVTHR